MPGGVEGGGLGGGSRAASRPSRPPSVCCDVNAACVVLVLQCAALVGEDQPLCPDLPELDLSELDVSDLDADSFLGGLKWYSDQSEIISAQYGNEASNLFEVS